MAEGVDIASLFATLGLKVNSGQWAQADEQIKKTQAAMDSLDKYASSLGVSRGAVQGFARQAAARERAAEMEQRAAARTAAAQVRAAEREEAAKMRASAAAARAIRSLEREEAAAARRAQAVATRAAAAQQRAATAAHRKIAASAKKAHEDSAKAAEESAKKTNEAFGSIGTAIKAYALYLGGSLAYEHLIKFNQEVQDNTISLAAMIEGQLGGSFQQATGHAKELYGEWQKFSTQTPVTTAEIMEFGKSIAAATFNAKGSLKDLTQLTEQGVIAAKVLAGNRNAGYAALEISEMLSGNVSNRMMFVKQLLGMIHMTEDQFRGLDEKGRLEAVKRALGSDAFKDAAKAFGDSFSGVTSTLKDKLQIAFGKIGLPIFERITAAVARFNEWLDKNAATISRVGGAISDGLAIAWDVVVAVWNKAYDIFDRNRDVITKIAEKVGTDLWTAFQAFVVVLDVALDQVDSLLHFFDHGFGKFLLDALLMPNLLLIIADLLDRIGVKMQTIKDIASFNIFGKLFDLIGGGGDDAESETPPRRALPGIGLGDIFAKRAQELDDQAQKAGTQEERDQLLERSNQLRMMMPAPQLPAPAPGGGPVALNVTVGDINVHAPNADPVAVGDQVRKVFHEELGGVLLQTMDVYG